MTPPAAASVIVSASWSLVTVKVLPFTSVVTAALAVVGATRATPASAAMSAPTSQ